MKLQGRRWKFLAGGPRSAGLGDESSQGPGAKPGMESGGQNPPEAEALFEK